jgi:hypothetical protein
MQGEEHCSFQDFLLGKSILLFPSRHEKCSFLLPEMVTYLSLELFSPLSCSLEHEHKHFR